MLIKMVARERGIDTAAPWRAAANKVKTRTPYMPQWGDGISSASSAEEAFDHWQRVKQEEKKALAALNGRSDVSPRPAAADAVTMAGIALAQGRRMSDVRAYV
jgi:hypothetical protein